MLKKLIFWILSLGLVSCSRYSEINDEGCCSIPLTFFSFSESPVAQIEIENEKYNALVDLGGQFAFSLHKSCLDKIQDKRFLTQHHRSDVKGNDYFDDCFEIPLVSIPGMNLKRVNFKNAPVSEKSLKFGGNQLFRADTTQREIDQRKWIDGSIGTGIFLGNFCLFDLNRSLFFISDALEKLKAPYFLDEVMEVPFEDEHGFVVVYAQTDFGTRKMLLDTGAGGSVFRESIVDKKRECEPGIWRTTTQLRMGEVNCGDWDFFLYEFPEMYRDMFDAVLGVDFFMDHIVCVDYQNKKLYIKPLNKPLKKFWKKIVRCFY